MSDFFYCILPFIFLAYSKRMKFIIAGFFSLFLWSSMALAFDCPSGNDMTEPTCNATAGCYFNMGACQKCDWGQFSAANKNTCELCDIPTGAVSTGPGTAKKTCPWKITCSAGTYWNGSECASCNSNQTSSASTITFNGTGTWPASNNTCVYKAVLIKLEKNQGVFDIDKQVYAKCDEGFSDNKNGPWRDAPDKTPTLWWGQTFYGYYTDPNGGTKRFDENGKLANGTTACIFTDEETTLYAHWQQKPYYVEYYYGTETTAAQTQNCYLGTECKALAPNNNKAPEGQAFDQWQCTSGCTGNVKKGDIIKEPEATKTETTPVIKLKATWTPCNKGHYCSNGQSTPCPIGSTTSTTGATTKADCIIKSDNNKTYSSSTECAEKSNGTCFCDNNGCFTLPGTSIYKAN